MKKPEYFEVIHHLLDKAASTQSEAISTAADLIATSIAGDHLFHVFGTGHAHLLAEEIFYRSGGLLSVNPILETGLMLHDSALVSSQLERLHGLAQVVLAKHRLEEGDVILIASNSGINAVPIEVALEARRLGLPVIALTSLEHSRGVDSRHHSGKKLFELADVVLDNGGCVGDAALSLPGLTGKIGATSSIIGMAILHWLVQETIVLLLARGLTPDIILSANLPGGEAHNAAGFARLRGRIRCL
jgi:uncharacterized phosphosugar-binding protein